MIQNYKRNRAHLARAQQYCAVCTFSTHMSAECIRNGIHPSRVTYIRPFSPYTRSAGETAIRSSPLSIRDENEPLHIAFLGRLEPDKGVGMLLRALAVVTRNLGRRMVVTIAGEGRRSIALRKLASGIVASSRGLTIDFTGWLSAEQVKDLLARIDLLAVPSVWPEPFGLVGLDAATYGVPSAAYAVGGIIDWLVDGQNGHLAKRLTSEGLADAIVECLENPQHHASLCRGALEVSSRFSPETHMKSLEEMLSAAAAISHSPPTH
jgi:glycosyltransferase involved in cell wall biosynthesis